MSKDTAQRLVDILHEWADEYLRSVAYFEKNKRDIIYIREDIKESYTEEDQAEVFNDLSFDALGKERQEDLYTHGDLNCIARWFDDAIELHFPHDKRSGTAVALEPHAVLDLEGLINACLRELRDESPQV